MSDIIEFEKGSGYCSLSSYMNKGSKTAEIDIIGVIGWEVWDTDVAWMLAGINESKDIHVKLDSLGGSIHTGVTIHNLLLNHKAKVTIDIIGKAVSMGSGISQSGDVVRMNRAGSFMLHNPWSGMAGEAKDLRKQAETLDHLKDSLINLYTRRSGKSRDEISQMMDAETWLTAEEALEHGFIDEIIESNTMEAAALVIPSNLKFLNIPAFAQDNIKTETKKMSDNDKKDDPALAGKDDNAVNLVEAQASITKLTESVNTLTAEKETLTNGLKAANEALEESKTALNAVNQEIVTVKAEAQVITEKAGKLANKLGVNLASVTDDELAVDEPDKTPKEIYNSMPKATAEDREARAIYYSENIKNKGVK